MATIDELMKDKKPGEIKITCPPWQSEDYFLPYFKIADQWHGFMHDKRSAFFRNGLNDRWRLYEEPKKTKKVVLWQWWYKDGLSYKEGFLTHHMTEDYRSKYYLTNNSNYTKIESTRIEIEVPDES